METIYNNVKRYIIREQLHVVIVCGVFLFMTFLSRAPFLNLIITSYHIISITLFVALLLLNVPVKTIAKGILILFFFSACLLYLGKEQAANSLGNIVYVLLWISAIQLLRNR